jgi:hypothetical protein
MGFLDNTSITVDAILTKKGRELLARGQNEFKITKFALADDEIDYNLYDTSHPNGSNFYAAVIENMPLLEAFVDENQLMRYKLTTLPKETANLPILDIVGGPTFTFDAPGTTDTITPSTRNAPQESYTFTLFNADLASLAPEGETGFTDTATTTAFLNAAERKRSFTVVGKSVRLTARSLTVDTNTNLQVTGNTSGATVTLPITVKKDPSRT